MIVELNEIKLVSELAKLCREWVANIRFTHELASEVNMTIDDLSTTPQVHEFDLPIIDTATDVPIGTPLQENREKKLFPCVIIRVDGSEINKEDDGYHSEVVNINFDIYVSEHDKDNRNQFIYLAKKYITNGLLHIPNKVLANTFTLDPNIVSVPFDNSQMPKLGLVLTTKWKYLLPQIASSDMRKFNF